MDPQINLKSPTSDEEERQREKAYEAGALGSKAASDRASAEGVKETAGSGGCNIDENAVESARAAIDDSAPPDGGYGWVVVACCVCMNACTWGINSSYGIYLSYYLTHDPPLFTDASTLDYAFIGGLVPGFGMVISPITNLFIRRYSSNTALLIGCALQCASMMGASFAYKVWHLYLAQGILFGIGMGMIFVASVTIIPQWFSKRRSVANGIAAAGSGIGGLAFSLGTNAMLQNLGLAWTFRITGIVAFAVNTTCSLIMKDRNKAINPDIKMFDMKILRKCSFWYIVGWGAFSMLGYIVILYSLPNYGESVGLTASQASIAGACLNLGMAIGRPLVGLYSDSWGRINIAGALTFVCALTVFVIWVNAHSFGVMIFFAIINGAICGTFWTTAPPVTAEVFTLKELPSALNLLWLGMIAPLTFSEAIGLALRQVTWVDGVKKTSYLHPQIFAGMMYVAASICMLLLRVWKIKHEDDKAGETTPQERFGKGRKQWFRWVKV